MPYFIPYFWDEELLYLHYAHIIFVTIINFRQLRSSAFIKCFSIRVTLEFRQLPIIRVRLWVRLFLFMSRDLGVLNPTSLLMGVAVCHNSLQSSKLLFSTPTAALLSFLFINSLHVFISMQSFLGRFDSPQFFPVE